MKYHPHGDASIGDAIIQLGQKDLLIDTQGNWGNANRRFGSSSSIREARPLLAQSDFQPKGYARASSYDGRNKEPVTFPQSSPFCLLRVLK